MGLGRREERSFGGVVDGVEFLERKNLGSHDLESFESSMASMRSRGRGGENCKDDQLQLSFTETLEHI